MNPDGRGEVGSGVKMAAMTPRIYFDINHCGECPRVVKTRVFKMGHGSANPPYYWKCKDTGDKIGIVGLNEDYWKPGITYTSAEGCPPIPKTCKRKLF